MESAGQSQGYVHKTMFQSKNEDNGNIRPMKDHDLLDKLENLVRRERNFLKEILIYLAEVDRRRLYAKQGYSSMYQYCLERFHWPEGSTYRRIQAARLSLRYPEILDCLEMGKINLASLDVLAPYLKNEQDRKLIQEIFGKTKSQTEYFVASLHPNEDPIDDRIQKIPSMLSRRIANELKRTTELVTKESNEDNRKKIIETATRVITQTAQIYSTSAGNILPHQNLSSQPSFKIEPLSSQSVKIEFRASAKFAKLIERAREVLGHRRGELSLEDIFIEALEMLLEKKDPQRKIERMEKKQNLEKAEKLKNDYGQQVDNHLPVNDQSVFKNQMNKNKYQDQNSARPNVMKRYIPEPLRREIYKRDGGACSFKSIEGRRCGARTDLEVDHIIPWGLGGTTRLENLRLLCRMHNQWRAIQTYSRMTVTKENHLFKSESESQQIKEPSVMYG